MSNVSLGGNHGNSINFDGAVLQNEQEDEYRREEELQQNELRALLTNAFDDLIDEDEILSISDDGTDSRNVSLVRRHSNDSLSRMVPEENRICEEPEPEWGKLPAQQLQRPSNVGQGHDLRDLGRIPQLQYGQFEPLSRTQELPRHQIDLLRASVESLPAYPTSREGKGRQAHKQEQHGSHGNPSVHGSRDHLDSDYHSTGEENHNQKAEFHGNVYQGQDHQVPQGQVHQVPNSQGHLNRQTSQNDLHSNKSERENMLRRSIEDFAKFKEAYQAQQNPDAHQVHEGHYYGNTDYPGNMPTHQHYHTAEHPYDQGHYYLSHDHVPHQGYEGHYHDDTHNHFRNIYTDRPYHTIGERGETEGGNVIDGMHFYHHGYQQVPHGYHDTNVAGHEEGESTGYPREPGYFSHAVESNKTVPDSTSAVTTVNNNKNATNTSMSSVSGSAGRKLPQVTYRFQNVNNDTGQEQGKSKGSNSDRNRIKGTDKNTGSQRAGKDSSKVDRDGGGRSKRDIDERYDPSVDKDFMEQGGSGDSQQLAQLQILYKARGRKIEELKNELENLKSDSGRELRILKHQLSVAKGEKEGSSKSLDSVQSLLQEAKSDNSQLIGRVNACESQIEGLKKGKEELIKKLQTAESTIETLHEHLEELGSSDTLTRARNDHENVIGGLQRKYETEVKHLKENIDKLNETVQEKMTDVTTLKQKLADSVKMSEAAHISRAETINRLTQSLEESQKRCRNLLEASSSQEMSQIKIQLQQAFASKSISDEMCSSLQEEIQDLKEQVQMLESASNLGLTMVTNAPSSTATAFVDQNDSMADLGIKKTLDFDTPQGTPTTLKSHSVVSGGSDVVTSLKSELERCLVSNKQKRSEVIELKEEMRKVRKDMLEFKQRCERADLLTHEQKKRISDLESCLSPSEKTSAIENRLKKDIDNLKREKKILLEDVEELQKRLDEISNSEEKLTELNRELSKQIADMVKEYDDDKRQAVDRAHRAGEQVLETSRNKLRHELTIQFDGERSNIIAKYEQECSNLREELKAAQDEIDRVKDEYCKISEDTERMKEEINKQFEEKLQLSIRQVTETLAKETEIALLQAEETWTKKKESEIKTVTEAFENVKIQLKVKLESEIGEANRRAVDNLKIEHKNELKNVHDKFEGELKAMKDILELEKSNDLEKLDKEKLNEVEKLKKVIIDKDLYISEKDQQSRESETLLSAKKQVLDKLKTDCCEKDKIIESLKMEYKNNFDRFREELNEKSAEIDQLKTLLEGKISVIKELESELKNMEGLKEKLRKLTEELENLQVEKMSSEDRTVREKVKEIENLRTEMNKHAEEKLEIKEELDNVRTENQKLVEEKNEELNKLRREIDRIERDKEAEIDRWRKEEVEKDEIETLRKGLDKNVQRERQAELEGVKKEVICLKLEIERMESERQMEIDKVCRIKQAEIDNIEKRRIADIERVKKEKLIEMEKVLKEKDSEMDRLKKYKEEEEERLKKEGTRTDLSSKVRERLNKDMEEDMRRAVETKVAMSKVVWLEEHRATRQAAIDNAVRLTEAELKLKMEEELESRLESRLEEAKILWQSDSMNQLEDERHNWDSIKHEEISAAIEQERNTWRDTELAERLETERQKCFREFELRLEEEKESWREFELETEKLKWTSEWEQKLQSERESWVKNTLEPTKRKWKHEFEEKLRLEKENWRCMELETEKLTLLREYEARLAQEKQSWINKTLPEALAKEKSIWKTETEQKLKKERENWRNCELPRECDKVRENCKHDFDGRLKKEQERWSAVDLPRELDMAREKWYEEVEGRLREERNNWKNCDLPEEIEKERRKWMKLMEQTLLKEKDNWRNRDLPSEVEKAKQGLETEMETRLVSKLEMEKDKLQKESEAKVLEAIEEHQDACKEELYRTIAKETERLQQNFDTELQERFLKEKKIWREMVDAELAEKLEIEREKWKGKSESDLNKRLEAEKEKLKCWFRADMDTKIDEEKKAICEQLEEDFDQQMKIELDRLRAKFEQESREDFEHLKKKFENEGKEEIERLKIQLEHETQMNIDKEREILHLQTECEMSQKLGHEEEKWKSEFEKELGQKLQNEEQKWKEMIEKDIDNRLKQEREVWGRQKEEEFDKRTEEMKEMMKTEWEKEKTEEIKQMTETLKDKLRAELDEDMEKFKVDVEHEFHLRVEHEVNLAVQEARDDWNREYMMEMSINTTSAEASQGLLREEIESLKHQLESVQSEVLEKERTWLKDKEDLLLQKDLERRQALDKLQEQAEVEYKQFIEEHKDTLDKALKSAREQHTKDKAELEDRFNTQMKLLQAREKALQEQLQKSIQGSQDHHDNLAEYEKERVMWFEERDRLVQDIAERDSLLGKADVHLSKEVDKLRSELQAAYQRRLESEMNSWCQKMEAEYSRANNSEQKEKLQLEKQLSEVNTELNKLKAQWREEKVKHIEEVKSLTDKLNGVEKRLHDHNRLEGELKKAKELLKGYKDELTDNQGKCEKHKLENEDLTTKLNKAIQHQEKLQGEVQKLKDEKNESMQSIESSYRKDVSAYKQRLEESNARTAKTEKLLQDMKHKYRTELESLRKALEAENDVAMNAMKNKMIELQKKHVAIVDEMRRKHQTDREELLKHGQAAVGRGVTPTPNTGDVEEIDKTVKELRSQYLDTVAKIKDDVLRHITETNVRAAETVKFEMDKERMTTFQQIKDFYRQNVKTILETELVGATLESKLLAVEEALDNLSSNPSSRSATPKSDEFILDERQMKSRSRSASRDAGISPKGQRSVSFTSGTKGERSRTPVLHSGKDLNVSGGFDDPRSPKNRMFTKSPREAHITMRGERTVDHPDVRGSLDWKYESMKDSSFDTRRQENRPTSAKSMMELRGRDYDTRDRENRPLSAKSPRELHLSLRERGGDYDYNENSVYDNERDRNRSGDKRRSRTLISTRDIHSGRYTRTGDGNDPGPEDPDLSYRYENRYENEKRAKSVTPMYSSMSRSSPSLYRPTSVPDLSSEDKELKLWTETNNDTYRYTPLRETLRTGTNLHRTNSKSESDLSIADKNFSQLKPDYDSNLDLSTGSLASDLFMSPRKPRDAGETPTSTPRRHVHRKHYTLHSFPTRDQISSEIRKCEQGGGDNNHSQTISNRNDDIATNSPIAGRTSRKNLPLIQFRHGKVQGLAKTPGTSSKSPHPEEGVIVRDTPPTRDTSGTPDRPYRPLSVSSNTHMNF